MASLLYNFGLWPQSTSSTNQMRLLSVILILHVPFALQLIPSGLSDAHNTTPSPCALVRCWYVLLLNILLLCTRHCTDQMQKHLLVIGINFIYVRIHWIGRRISDETLRPTLEAESATKKQFFTICHMLHLISGPCDDNHANYIRIHSIYIISVRFAYIIIRFRHIELKISTNNI